MNLVFLRPVEVEAIWHEVAPEFGRVVEKAIHGEFTTDDLYWLAREGKVTVGVAREKGKVVMAVVFEFVFIDDRKDMASGKMVAGCFRFHFEMERLPGKIGNSIRIR